MKFFTRLLLVITIFLASLNFVLSLNITTFAQTNTGEKPLNASQAASTLTTRTSTAIDNAVNSVIALPKNIFPNCFIDSSRTAARVNGVAKVDPDQLVNCLQDILRNVFIVAIIWVIISIAAENMGIVLRSGEGEGAPIANARKKIEKAIIGLVLIGGASLLLNLFSSNLVNFQVEPLQQLPNLRTPSFSYMPTAPKTVQAAQHTNQYNGTQRTDIQLNDADPTNSNKYTATPVAQWVNNYFQKQGSSSPVVGQTWVTVSRNNGVPLQQMIALGRISSGWGNAGGSNALHECANSKRNLFAIPYTQSEVQSNKDLQRKIKNGTAVECDYIKTFSSFSDSVLSFGPYYSQNLADKTDCHRWESYGKKNTTLCPKIKKESDLFLSYLKSFKVVQ